MSLRYGSTPVPMRSGKQRRNRELNRSLRQDSKLVSSPAQLRTYGVKKTLSRALAKGAGALLLLCALALPAEARERLGGYCNTQTAGARVASCTVTVYLTGTVTLATLYADNIGTPKANPFTASSAGYWFFYADDGRYDVRFSGGTPSISPPYTMADFLLFDNTTSGQDATFAGDVLPASAGSGNVGTAAVPWGNGRFNSLTVNTAMTAAGTLSVTGASTLTGAASLGNNLTVSGVTSSGSYTTILPQDGSQSIGANINRWQNMFFVNGSATGTLSVAGLNASGNVGGAAGVFGSGSVAQSGEIRLPNTGSIKARNGLDNGDVTLISGGAGTDVTIGSGSPGVYIPGTGFLAILNGGSKPNSGSVRIYNNSFITSSDVLASFNIPLIGVNGSDVVVVGQDSVSVAPAGITTTNVLQHMVHYPTALVTFADGQTTPAITASNVFKTANTAPTSITNFTGGQSGQVIYIICGDTNTTFVDGASLKLAGNLVCTADDTITLVYDGGAGYWREVARSVN